MTGRSRNHGSAASAGKREEERVDVVEHTTRRDLNGAYGYPTA